MAAGGTSSAVKLGPGRIWVAAIGTTDPTSASAALPSAWREIGYTEQGHVFGSEVTTEEVLVAEELDPIRFVNTKYARSVQFEMAEATRRNLALALNIGANESNGAAGLEPIDAADEVRVMIAWDSEETAAGNAENVRWLFRQGYQVAAIEIAHRKAPAKSLIPVRFQLEKPDSAASYKVFPNASGHIA